MHPMINASYFTFTGFYFWYGFFRPSAQVPV
ncbi:hypothetical protein SAMN06269301_3186 [Geobacter sp. DSM 9736]|nr:hypothetical protein SAMN06269301_3186 [Geobacter sp. DSM 9736]